MPQCRPPSLAQMRALEIRAKDQELSAATIAERLGVSTRQVNRWLAADREAEAAINEVVPESSPETL